MLIEKWSHLMLTIRGEVSQPVWYLKQILCVSKLVQNRMLCRYIITPPANSDSTNCLNKFANLVFKRQRPAVVRTQSPKIALCHNDDQPHWVEPAMYCELDQTWDSAECARFTSTQRRCNELAFTPISIHHFVFYSEEHLPKHLTAKKENVSN